MPEGKLLSLKVLFLTRAAES